MLPRLSKAQRAVMLGDTSYSSKVKYAAEKKLEKIQESLTDPDYIEAVNSFIQQAWNMTVREKDRLRIESPELHKKFNEDLFFHRAMKKLTREAGIRNLR